MDKYAIRKSDRQLIKIGNCDQLYRLRFNDRHLFESSEQALNLEQDFGIYWRLPYPEEDKVVAGDYELDYPVSINGRINQFCDLDNDGHCFQNIIEHTGIIPLDVKKLGLHINLCCYHGLRKNKETQEISFTWEKKKCLALHSLYNTENEMKIGVMCLACGRVFTYSLKEIQDYIYNQEMKKRIFEICYKYWEEKNVGIYPFYIQNYFVFNTRRTTLKRIKNIHGDNFMVNYDYKEDEQPSVCKYFKDYDTAYKAYLPP